MLIKKLIDFCENSKSLSITPKDLLDIDYPGEELATFGDLYVDKKGIEIPIE